MATVPVTRTWTAGEIVTASHFNTNIRDVLNFLLAPPLCQVRQDVSQNLTSGSFAALTFTTEDVDSSGMHSTSSNTSRLTAVYPGWYRLSATVAIAANATGRRGGRYTVNGTAVNGSSALNATPSSASATPLRTMEVYLNVGDYAEAGAFQDSGTTPLATVVTVGDQSTFCAKWESN